MMPLLTKGKVYVLAGLAAAGALAVLLLFPRGEEEVIAEETRFLMGTYCTVRALGEGTLEDAVSKALDEMERVYEKFSHHDKSSPVYEFNYLSRSIADEEIISLIKKSLEINRTSGGAFDITVYPLMRLWGFYGENPSVPAEEEIKSALEKVDGGKLEVSAARLDKSIAEVRIDLGGIAKGYAVDRAAKILRKENVNSALIDAGGDIYALGQRSGRKWRVGIRHPRSEEIFKILHLSEMAVATSGDYERHFYRGSRRYHHILDPRTGFPSTAVASVTAIAPTAAEADAWATAFFVLGGDEALGLAENLTGIECMIITPAMEILKSSGFDDYLQSRS